MKLKINNEPVFDLGVYYTKQLQTTAALSANDERIHTVTDLDFQELFQTIPGNYIVVAADDPDFTILAENEAHAKAVYVKPDDVIGLPVLVAFPDTSEVYINEGTSELLESFRKVIRTKKPDIMPAIRYDIARSDGQLDQRYWRLSHHPLINRLGEVTAIVQRNEDITEEVKSKHRLEVTKTQLDEALSVGLIGTWVWELDENKVYSDETLAKIFGLNKDEAAQGLPVEDVMKSIHPFDIDRIQKSIATAIEKQIPFEEEYRTISEDGTRRWVLARGHIDLNENGNLVRFPGVAIDITERKTTEFNFDYLSKASKALSSSLDYKKTLQKIAQLAVPHIADWCMVDILNDKNEVQLVALAHRDPEKVEWAMKLRQKQGAPRLDDLTGTGKVIRTGKSEFYPLITDELLEQVAEHKEQMEIIRSVGMTSAMTVPLMNGKKAYGAITLISAELKRQYTQNDLEMAQEIAHRASLAMINAQLYREAQREIAERKRLEEELVNMNTWLERRVAERTKELKELNVNLERSNRELEDFAYVASHDLQEPLRKIQAFSDLLQDQYSSQLGDGKDYLERMHKAAARMSTLIEDLLSFSRVTTKGQQFEKVDLKKVAEEVTGDLEARINDTKGIINIGELPSIHADHTQIQQLFQNLIGNALKFHKPDEPPVVTVSATTKPKTKSKPTRVRLEIQDNGVGFDEKYLDRIFAVFQRLHGRESYEGTGIGLAVCKKIVERHDGIITAKSKLGKGTTFIVTLPLEHEKEKI